MKKKRKKKKKKKKKKGKRAQSLRVPFKKKKKLNNRSLIDRVASDYVRLLKYGDSLYRCKELKRAAFGELLLLLLLFAFLFFSFERKEKSETRKKKKNNELTRKFDDFPFSLFPLSLSLDLTPPPHTPKPTDRPKPTQAACAPS